MKKYNIKTVFCILFLVAILTASVSCTNNSKNDKINELKFELVGNWFQDDEHNAPNIDIVNCTRSPKTIHFNYDGTCVIKESRYIKNPVPDENGNINLADYVTMNGTYVVGSDGYIEVTMEDGSREIIEYFYSHGELIIRYLDFGLSKFSF